MPPKTKNLHPIYTQGRSIVLCRGNSWAELSPVLPTFCHWGQFLCLGCHLCIGLRSCTWIFEIARSGGREFHGRRVLEATRVSASCSHQTVPPILRRLHCMTYKVPKVSTNLFFSAETWASSLLLVIRCVGELSSDIPWRRWLNLIANLIWHHMMMIYSLCTTEETGPASKSSPFSRPGYYISKAEHRRLRARSIVLLSRAFISDLRTSMVSNPRVAAGARVVQFSANGKTGNRKYSS